MKLFPRQPWVPISLGIPCTHKIDCGMIEKHSMFS
jgi:hypothetical protein